MLPLRAGGWVGWSKPGLALCPGRSQGPTAATTGAPILSWWGPRAHHSRSMTPSPGGFVALLFPGVHTCLSRPRPGGGPAPGLVSPEPAQAGADGSGLQPPEPLTRAQPLSRLWGSPVTTPPGPGGQSRGWEGGCGGGVRPGSCPVLCFTAAVARWCPQCEDADPGQLLLRRASAVPPTPNPGLSGLHRFPPRLSLVSSWVVSLSHLPLHPRLLVRDPRLCDPPGSMVLPHLRSLCLHAPTRVLGPAAGQRGRGVLAAAPHPPYS